MRGWPWVWLVLGHVFTLNIVRGKQFATFKKMKFLLVSMCPKYAEDFGVDRIHFLTNMFVVLSKIMILKDNLLDTEELSMYLLVLSTVIRQVYSLS